MIVLLLSLICAAAALQPASFGEPSIEPAWQSECGQSSYSDAGVDFLLDNPDAKIVGGRDARVNEFPWQVSLRTSGHFCAALVINTRWVLTAAHCTDGQSPGSISVIFGAQTRNTPDPSTFRVSRSVSRITQHSSYNGVTDMAHDVSLIQVSSAVTFSNGIQPVCRPPGTNYVGERAVVSGWGTLSSGGISANILQYTVVTCEQQSTCSAAYGSSFMDPEMMCAMDAGRDSCQGDSGGPLVVKNTSGRFEIVGIVSWGSGCADPGYPGVYAFASNYATWVANNIS